MSDVRRIDPPQMQGLRQRLCASVAVAVLATIAAEYQVAEAYEWANGPGASCSGGYWGVVSAFTYGDFNMYTNYGLFYYEYNLPYGQLTYSWKFADHQSFSSSAAEAENYVDGPVDTVCALK